MTHTLTALIGRHDLLNEVAGPEWADRLVGLNDALSLFPLLEDRSDTPIRLGPEGDVDKFRSLTGDVLKALSAASCGGALAYVETEYFGGLGGQGAVVFADTRLVYGPTFSRIGPINTALRLLGVNVRPPAIDEFATVGLGKHRRTEDWLGAKSWSP